LFPLGGIVWAYFPTVILGAIQKKYLHTFRVFLENLKKVEGYDQKQGLIE
jgi:hypothetical protein